MGQFDMCDITEHRYHDGIVTRLNSHCFSGTFPEEETEATGLISFYYEFSFKEVPDVFERLPDVTGAKIISFKITPCKQGYDVKLCIEAEEIHAITFRCTNINCALYRYNGMSYRNVYDNIDFAKALRYISDEQWYKGEEQIRVADDLTIVHSVYLYEEHNPKGNFTISHAFGKYRVLKNGSEVYSFLNVDDQVTLKEPLILHSNGRRYLAFHVDLYGISYLDPDSGEAYNYVPEGYTHDYRSVCGESFIVTDIHYDRESDLIAYGGCYWAGSSEVFVGNLHEPLQYDPHLLRIHELLDPEWEEIEDIDFVRWDSTALVVNCDGKELSLPLDTLRKNLALM